MFEDTRHLVQSAVDGYNVCIFAYGQTGELPVAVMLVLAADRQLNHTASWLSVIAGLGLTGLSLATYGPPEPGL